MTVDARDMAEDVADMTDDVLDLAAEAPEMRADVQGAEGSDADDAAEGFPSGPRDPSVLTSFADHVAHAVWRLSPLIDYSVITGNPGLISAFVERWHGETSTFHLPVGEFTITLDDVSLLLHLPITGALHNFHALSTEEARFLLTELLEVSAEEARAETMTLTSLQVESTSRVYRTLTSLRKLSSLITLAETALTRGAYVRLGWVRGIYETRCQARRWIVAARAYLLHLVGCTLFANKSATYVHVVHLDVFRDLAQSGGYALGVVALVHMYDQLDEACRTTTRQLAGYLTLLQCVTDDTYQETSPRASRWLTSKVHMKGITGAPYRARCDALTVTDVSWLPYTEHRGVRAFEEISSFQGQLRWGPMVVTARPERVVRQFGYIQSIPSPSVSARLSHNDIDDRWMHFVEHVLPAGQLVLVPGQVSTDYMEWFFRISHPFMIPTQAGDQPRDAPVADPEDYIQPPSPQDCLTIVRGGASADESVRACQRRRTDH
ncbi:protein MAIN-LIKE 1-like [Glycine max]|uniref:protein MAIN-LIKE 1-like n=1 Tax=Glycine max TaxID=3847 RepID=UPI0003DE97A0|nr:protein MAIN-LIKE 1-like [Glycine max]